MNSDLCGFDCCHGSCLRIPCTVLLLLLLLLLLPLLILVLLMLASTLQALQDKYKGLIGEEFIDDYLNYAQVLFDNFGHRVRDWMTFNEPWVTCVLQVCPSKYICVARSCQKLAVLCQQGPWACPSANVM